MHETIYYEGQLTSEGINKGKITRLEFNCNSSCISIPNTYKNLISIECLETNPRNKISSMSVENLELLIYLRLYRIKLETLLIVNLPNLILINCRMNFLEKLILNNLTLLSLTELDCSKNNLNTLEVNDLINLRLLNCQKNQLKELLITNLINLKTLRCGNNKLSELNISNNTKLEALDYRNIPFINLIGKSYCPLIFYINSNNSFVNCLKNNVDYKRLENLNTLYCSNSEIIEQCVSFGYQKLCSTFDNKKIDRSFDNQKLCSTFDIQMVGRFNNQKLNTNFNNPIIKSYVLSSFSFDLNSARNLTTIDVSHNKIRNINKLVNSNIMKRLVIFNCNNNEIIELEIRGFEHLTYLNCSFNKIRSLIIDRTVSKLSELYCNNNELCYLDIIVENTNERYSDLYHNALSEIKILNCRNNNLRNLLLFNCHDLEEIDCSENCYLHEIYITQGRKIKNFKCENNVNLCKGEIINCNDYELLNLSLKGVGRHFQYFLINEGLSKKRKVLVTLGRDIIDKNLIKYYYTLYNNYKAKTETLLNYLYNAYYMPGMPGMLAAKEDFYHRANTQ